ncbi:HlyD family secretion protein [Microbulbifer guangxiensis]|uniref:HlyD family secretion protein n=1 Tax=Microbulbifer guangxiensis TaxID=2904249 RepID=UPI001F2FB497|nr:biotin/lipoyl-binding protein [Microbulbifer guangxiensis]
MRALPVKALISRLPAPVQLALTVITVVFLSGCEPEPPRVLGTLEWDRIALPAPVAEKIVEIKVREGDRVSAGQILMVLDDSSVRARRDAAGAEAERQQALLLELREGPRSEEIDRARADLQRVRSQLRDAEARYRRLAELARQHFVSRDDLDSARAAAESARAQVAAAEALLLELERGTRSERIDQAQAALERARSEQQVQQALLDKLVLHAPRPGLVDSIPFKLGDEAPIGGPLITMLVGEAPYARVYIPQPMRAGIQVGDAASVTIEGDDRDYPGRVRMIRSEPSFTPYYALTGEDVSRLSFLAEIQLDKAAVDLPSGLPLQARFPDASANVVPSTAPTAGGDDAR